MVARGDLGLEMPLERVPRAQKEITRAGRLRGVPVIVATQVLESMTTEARPTRAEVNDAANAVDDGVDAIMLAGETAAGAFPARAVQTLDAIIRDAECAPPAEAIGPRPDQAGQGHAQALCEAAVTLANAGNAQAIVAVTRGGTTARRLSALRPRAPIIAATNRDDTARRLTLYWGVTPVRIEIGDGVDAAKGVVSRELVARGLVPSGATVVLVSIGADLTRARRQLPQDSASVIPRAAVPTVESILFAFALAAVVVRVATFFVHRALGGLDVVSAENRAAVQARERQLRLALRLAAFGMAAFASLSLALERFGLAEPRWRAEEVAHWFLTHGINIIVIVALAFIVIRGANLAIAHLRSKVDRGHGGGDLEWQRRAATLGAVLSSLVTALVVFAALLMLLRELAIDVLPILTGAGIAGLAVGFGAQNLVRDVISGFFMILEDQVRVGDAARINGVAGTVEQINLRTVVLRDGEGAVQVFPNGTIATLANLSKHFAYAVVSVRVAYTESVDRVDRPHPGRGRRDAARRVVERRDSRAGRTSWAWSRWTRAARRSP